MSEIRRVKSAAKISIWTITGIAFFLYILLYGIARTSGDLVNMQNVNFPADNGVRAAVDDWRDIRTTLSGNSTMLRAAEFCRQHKPLALETVFWPLCKLESSLWRVYGKR